MIITRKNFEPVILERKHSGLKILRKEKIWANHSRKKCLPKKSSKIISGQKLLRIFMGLVNGEGAPKTAPLTDNISKPNGALKLKDDSSRLQKKFVNNLYCNFASILMLPTSDRQQGEKKKLSQTYLCIKNFLITKLNTSYLEKINPIDIPD